MIANIFILENAIEERAVRFGFWGKSPLNGSTSCILPCDSRAEVSAEVCGFQVPGTEAFWVNQYELTKGAAHAGSSWPANMDTACPGVGDELRAYVSFLFLPLHSPLPSFALPEGWPSPVI